LGTEAAGLGTTASGLLGTGLSAGAAGLGTGAASGLLGTGLSAGAAGLRGAMGLGALGERGCALTTALFPRSRNKCYQFSVIHLHVVGTSTSKCKLKLVSMPWRDFSKKQEIESYK
jgi:hypothetical protein